MLLRIVCHGRFVIYHYLGLIDNLARNLNRTLIAKGGIECSTSYLVAKQSAEQLQILDEPNEDKTSL